MAAKHNSYSVTRERLESVALPQQTKTYTVIPHGTVLDLVEKTIEQCGMEITKSVFLSSHCGNVMYATYFIKGDDPDMVMTYNLTNSYDKSNRFISCPGANITLTNNTMMSKHGCWKRLHTGTADTEAYSKIIISIQESAAAFQELKDDKQQMMSQELSTVEFGRVLGEMFARKLITSTEFNAAWKEAKKPSYDYNLPTASNKINLWIIYNSVLKAVNESSVRRLLERQVNIHEFFRVNYCTQKEQYTSIENLYENSDNPIG